MLIKVLKRKSLSIKRIKPKRERERGMRALANEILTSDFVIVGWMDHLLSQ